MASKTEQFGANENLDAKNEQGDDKSKELTQEQEQVKSRQKSEIQEMGLDFSEQQKAEEYLEKKYKENAKEAQDAVEAKIKLWRPAVSTHSDVNSMTKEGSPARKKIKEIWNNKNISPQEKAKKLETIMQVLKTEKSAEGDIKKAKLAPSRKKGLQTALKEMWEYHEPEDMEKAIQDEIIGAINQGAKTYEKMKKRRKELSGLLDAKEDGIALFSSDEKKTHKKAWSKEIFAPFLSGKDPIVHTEKWLFAKITETKKETGKEMKDRKMPTREFAKIRKLLAGFSDKKSDKKEGSGIKFGKNLSVKNFSNAGLKDRKDILNNILSIAQKEQFESAYGEKMKANGASAFNAFFSAMRLDKWVKNQAEEFEKEFEKDAKKGLALKDWSEAHEYFNAGKKRLDSFADSDQVLEKRKEYEGYLKTCESEIDKDISKMEGQKELSNKDKEKIALWRKNPIPKLANRIKKLNGEEVAENSEEVAEKTEALEQMTDTMKDKSGLNQKAREAILNLLVLEKGKSNLKAEGKDISDQETTSEEQKKKTFETPHVSRTADDYSEKKKKIDDMEKLETTNERLVGGHDNVISVDFSAQKADKKQLSQEDEQKMKRAISEGGNIQMLNTQREFKVDKERSDLQRNISTMMNRVEQADMKILFSKIKDNESTRKMLAMAA